MVKKVVMPSAGQTTDEATVTKILVKVGDSVKKGDPLLEVETDKTVLPIESFAKGFVTEIFVKEFDKVDAGTALLAIGDEKDLEAAKNGASAAAPAPAAAPVPVAAADDDEDDFAPIIPGSAPVVAAAPAPVVSAPVAKASGDYKAMPNAKKLASELGVDLSTVVPANGEFIKASDVKLAAENKPAAAAEATAPEADYVDEKLPNIRKVIAKAMHTSLSTMAQLTLNTSFDATKILALREQLKANAEKFGYGNITLNDMILFAVSRVILNHRSLNANYLDDTMRFFNTVNLGIAVDTDRGLLVPTLAHAEKLSLNELSAQAKALIGEAQKGTIAPDKLKNGSFTVTNLGSLGIESFTPVINPPQTGILGVDTITRRIKEVNGEDVTYPAMGLSLTFDHRALDGAPAAKFLKELVFALENFDMLLIK
ncbi:MAG: 2-oxo acid dehydrogenase subunit E2 [Clostridia bacterium]|nr:2-oxo acid dehydrogenase subunit E2 [Clostridia bacterium]